MRCRPGRPVGGVLPTRQGERFAAPTIPSRRGDGDLTGRRHQEGRACEPPRVPRSRAVRSRRRPQQPAPRRRLDADRYPASIDGVPSPPPPDHIVAREAVRLFPLPGERPAPAPAVDVPPDLARITQGKEDLLDRIKAALHAFEPERDSLRYRAAVDPPRESVVPSWPWEWEVTNLFRIRREDG